jgi:hypothetical protein
VRDVTDVGAGRAPDADDDNSLDGALGEFAAALRAPVDFGAGVDLAVMAAVRLAPPLTVIAGGAAPVRPAARSAAPARRPGVLVRGARWFARPRPVRVSPLGALMAAGLAFATVFGLRREAPTRPERDLARTGEFPTATGEFPAVAAAPAAPAGVAPARDTVFVTRFMLVAPGAKQVALVGDFNDWDRQATPLIRASGQGMWTVELPLTAGRYNYAFLVDGHRWTADPAAPAAPRTVADDYGQPSSVVTVRGA